MPQIALVVIAIALLFDYINGFHDSANSIATVVARRVLRPARAVLWAAFFNLAAAFLLGTGVAASISKD
jgi:PiT family inorganic phosphate transporter